MQWFVGNLDNFLMGNISEDAMSGDIPESVFAMFQMTFAVITPALIVGAFAERMRFSAMLLFSVCGYLPSAHPLPTGSGVVAGWAKWACSTLLVVQWFILLRA